MRILIAGGGTGGHIYPAIAIADAICKIDSSATVEFVGTSTGLEAKLVPRANYKINFIPSGRLNKNVSLPERILTLFRLPLAFIKSIFLLLKYSPDVVVGVGGYASAPIVFSAALLRYRTIIWEPNAYPGLANRWLSYVVDQCLVVFEEAALFMKNKNKIRVHMPLRKEIEARATEKNIHDKFHVLVFGGSQGARAINNALSEAIVKSEEWLSDLEIVHQTGPNDFSRIEEMYRACPWAHDKVKALEYLHDMPDRYNWADLVISRSGTGTISELAACGKAALLIPLPTAADDHQTKNAQALQSIGGARLLPQSELSPKRLVEEILYLRTHEDTLTSLATNIKKFHKPNAAAEIAQIVLNS